MPRQHRFSTRHRHNHTALGVLTVPATLTDQVEDRLPILSHSPGNPHIREASLALKVEDVLHVIPQQLGHQAMLTSPATQRTPIP